MQSARTTIITDSPLCFVAGWWDRGAPLFIKRSRPRSGAGVTPDQPARDEPFMGHPISRRVERGIRAGQSLRGSR
jgi:hypothetical protein